MVGPEHVDRAVEGALELLYEVRDVRRPVGRRAALLGRADDHAVVVAVLARANPHRAVLLVRRQPREELVDVLLELALEHPGIEVESKALERALHLREHRRNWIAFASRELVDVRAVVAVLGRLLPAPARLDGSPEAVYLSARVVVVVLALDGVAGKVQQPRDGVAVGAVPRGGDGDRAGRVRRDHLDLHPLAALHGASSVIVVDLRERLREPGIGEPKVQESWAGDLSAFDGRQLGRLSRELLGQLARVAAPIGREPHGDVRGVVSVLGLPRPLQLDRHTRDARQLPGEPVHRMYRLAHGPHRRAAHARAIATRSAGLGWVASMTCTHPGSRGGSSASTANLRNRDAVAAGSRVASSDIQSASDS